MISPSLDNVSLAFVKGGGRKTQDSLKQAAARALWIRRGHATRRATAVTDGERAAITRYLCRVVSIPQSGELTDAQLLEQFVARRDAAAFEVLVWRHGPKVLGVCRHVLRHEQDAEDAFQATFLVLVRKAGSIGKRQAVGGWLSRVAYRVALRAKVLSDRRATQETLPRDVPGPAGPPVLVWRGLGAGL